MLDNGAGPRVILSEAKNLEDRLMGWILRSAQDDKREFLRRLVEPRLQAVQPSGFVGESPTGFFVRVDGRVVAGGIRAVALGLDWSLKRPVRGAMGTVGRAFAGGGWGAYN